MNRSSERKDLNYYLDLRYPITIHPDAEGGFVAEIEELPGCMTQAETLDGVFDAINEARRLWIETAYRDGQPIPLPRDTEQYSGKLLTRMPRSLHRSLAQAAKLEGVSINQLVTGLLAYGIGRAPLQHLFNPSIEPEIIPWGTGETSLSYKNILDMPKMKAIGRG